MSASRRLSCLLLPACLALKAHDFRKCADTPFCVTHREPAVGEWSVNATTVASPAAGVLSAVLVPPVDAESLALPLLVAVTVLKTGAVRVHVDEDPSLTASTLVHADPSVPMPEGWDEDMDGEWDAPMVRVGRAVKRRFEAAEHSLASADALAPATECALERPAPGDDLLRCALPAAGGAVSVRLQHSPLVISVLDAAGDAVAVLNGRGKLRWEPFRQALPSETAEAPSPPSSSFNGFTDPMAYGASSVGLDVAFPRASHAYGLPERTVDHALPHTRGKEPYRLFNLDVFEYEVCAPSHLTRLHAHGTARHLTPPHSPPTPLHSTSSTSSSMRCASLRPTPPRSISLHLMPPHFTPLDAFEHQVCDARRPSTRGVRLR